MGNVRKNSFVRQAAILAAASFIVRFLGFIYRVLLTGMIGDKGNGIYASGYYLYTFFLIVSSAGLPAAISKMVSERIEKKQYRNAHNVFRVSLLVAGAGGLVCSLTLFFGADFITKSLNTEDSYYTLLTLSPTIFIVAVMAVFRGYFQGLNTTVPTAISQIIEQLFNAVFSVYLAYLLVGYGVEFGAAGGTAGTGIGALAGLLFIMLTYFLIKPSIYRKIKFSDSGKYERKKDLAIKLMKIAFPIIIGTAIMSITNLADMTMVVSRLLDSGAYIKEEANVLYGQLTGKYVVLTTLPVSIATAMATATVPNLAASVAIKDTVMVKRKVDLALRITMIISIPAAIGIGVLGEQILMLLFRQNSEGGILLQVGSVAIIFLALAQIATGALQGIGKVHIPAITAGVGATIKILLNYFLIVDPRFNVLGAVISTIACYIAVSGLNFYFLMKYTGVKPDMANIFIKPVISSLVMGLACYSSYYVIYFIMPSNAIATIGAIIFGIIVYFIFLLFLRGLQREDILLMPGGQRLINLFEKFTLI